MAKPTHWRTLLKKHGWRPIPYDFGPAYARGEERILWDWQRSPRGEWVYSQPRSLTGAVRSDFLKNGFSSPHLSHVLFHTAQ